MTARALSVVAVARAAAVAITGAGGCAALPPCPARGGPAWIELTTEHFAVRTDLGDAAAHEVITDLEETRAAMLAAVWPGAPGPPDRVPVIALASNRELSTFTDPDVRGIWIRKAPFPATIVAGAIHDRDRRQVLRHELAHHLSRWFLPQQPLWFSEGIATFLETIHYDRERQRAVVGEPSADRYRAVSTWAMFPAHRLLSAATPAVVEMGQFEASSWLLVHYLINHRDDAFRNFQRRLGAFEHPRDAWAAELGDLDDVRLSTTLDEYAASGNYIVLHIPAPPWSGRIQTRAMSDAEVHGARAFMYAIGKMSGEPPLDRVRAEIAEALAVDPAALQALAAQYYLLGGDMSPVQRGALARQASEAHPDAAMAWLMVADAAAFGDARQTALARALALAPNDPEILTRLAVLKASKDRWDEAAAFSRKAIRLGATSAEALRIHTLSMAHTGHCREATFYVAGLPGPLVGGGARGPAITAGWLDLYDRCVRIAAERVQRRAREDADRDREDDHDADGDGDAK
jgi:hypothetical protein